MNVKKAFHRENKHFGDLKVGDTFIGDGERLCMKITPVICRATDFDDEDTVRNTIILGAEYGKDYAGVLCFTHDDINVVPVGAEIVIGYSWQFKKVLE